jgi:pimeloyl-ACP methyl ester carboxylesterase
MHSLRPAERGENRRTLLLIYIHGFNGNETSFQSFPAHLHNILTNRLFDSHVVHTKIYPRYKSRYAIEVARDNFSAWLEPHESPTTDVILIGHSMGGILAAEIALAPPKEPTGDGRFRHRILGTLNLDTPFLGMHPGLIVSGISSLFRPAPAAPNAASPRPKSPSPISPAGGPENRRPSATPSLDGTLSPSLSASLHTLPSNDPNYNPPFPNDVKLKDRTGWAGVAHFFNKYSDDLRSGTMSYINSHIEFSGTMADWSGLKARYTRIRALEDVDDLQRRAGQPPRVRFVNYYTASTGYPKKEKETEKDGRKSEEKGERRDGESMLAPTDTNPNPRRAGQKSPRSSHEGSTPRISLEEYREDGTLVVKEDGTSNLSPIDEALSAEIRHMAPESGVHPQGPSDAEEPPLAMQHMDSMPIDSDDDDYHQDADFHDAFEAAPNPSSDGQHQRPADAESKPKADTPPPEIALTPPEPVDPTLYTDKAELKAAQKDYKTLLKSYEAAVKAREKARKLADKQRKAELERLAKEREKQRKAEDKARAAAWKAEEKERERTLQLRVGDEFKSPVPPEPKKPKFAKFCLTPKDLRWTRDGGDDKCWVRVTMVGVDEVGAHCGLFFPGPQYEGLLGDCGARVGGWVGEEASVRVVRGLAGVDIQG